MPQAGAAPASSSASGSGMAAAGPESGLLGDASKKLLDSLTIGQAYESKDNVGNWWDVSITVKNPDGSYQCKVTLNSKTWDKVYPQNCRPLMEEKKFNGTNWLVA